MIGRLLPLASRSARGGMMGTRIFVILCPCCVYLLIFLILSAVNRKSATSVFVGAKVHVIRHHRLQL